MDIQGKWTFLATIVLHASYIFATLLLHCYIRATCLLHLCYFATCLLHLCYFVTTLLHACYIFATLLLACYVVATCMLHLCYFVTKVLHACYFFSTWLLLLDIFSIRCWGQHIFTWSDNQINIQIFSQQNRMLCKWSGCYCVEGPSPWGNVKIPTHGREHTELLVKLRNTRQHPSLVS